jgi:signal transduction histidine kinase
MLVMSLLEARTRQVLRRQREAEQALALTQAQVAREREYRVEQDRMVSMLAHELRTPLSGIQMSLRRVAQSPDVISQIDRAILYMSLIIERCVYSGRIDDRAIELRPEQLSTLDLVRSVCALSPAAERIELVAERDVQIESDPVILRAVLGNLIDNAQKYSAPGSAIRVTLTSDTGRQPGVAILVANQIGAAGAPDAARLFEKYYRSPHARRQSGSGLGLYIVRHLASLLGARIDYDPADEEVRFALWVPA